MKYKNQILATTLTSLAFFTLVPIATAQRGDKPASTTVRADQKERRAAALTIREKEMQNRADREVKRRLAALSKYSSRIGDMPLVTPSDKAVLLSALSEQIRLLTALQGRIGSASSTASLKEDIKSITESYRVYMLVMPRAAITAAASRTSALIIHMTTLGAKLQARITAASTAGANVTAAQAAMTDYLAKIADAQKQVAAALAAIASLKPDNGDATVAASNKAALKEARKKIQAAHQDLVDARKDAETIRKNLPKEKKDKTATTSASTR